VSKIFISYRREDAAEAAGRLADYLRQQFGSDNVYYDVDSFALGRDFRKAIEDCLGQCGVLLGVVGKQWLQTTDPAGTRRLDKSDDLGRFEIATALRREIPVIPVLVQGATVPKADELPSDLENFSFRNSFELSHARWNSDVQALVDKLRPLMRPAAESGRPSWPNPMKVQALVAKLRPFVRPAAPVPAAEAGRSSWPYRMLKALSTKAKLGLALFFVVVVVYWKLSPDRQRKVVEIQANHDGMMPTGIQLKPGQFMEITASGTIAYNSDSGKAAVGPEGDHDHLCTLSDCPKDGSPSAELIGKFDYGKVFDIGRQKKITDKELPAPAPMQLYLGLNVAHQLPNASNSGSFSVTVDVITP
jgi:TIR domain